MPDITEQHDRERALGKVLGPEADPQDAPAAPHIPESNTRSSQTNKQTLFLVAAMGVLLLFTLVFALSHKGGRKAKTDAKAKPSMGQQLNKPQAANVTPTDEITPPKEKDDDSVSAQDIERTKDPMRRMLANSNSSNDPTGSAGTNTSEKASVGNRAGKAQVGGTGENGNQKQLGSIPPFQQPNFQNNGQQSQQWQPQPYSQQMAQGAPQGNFQQSSAVTQDIMRERKDQVTKASLTFTRRPQPQPQGAQNGSPQSPTITNFGLRPGFHVAVRLESVASTGVIAPVTAVVEYNYERDGKILIPAGSRAIGRVDGADGSGHMGLSFSSLELPDGYAVPISAVGVGLDMQSVKGDVTGRQRGKALVLSTLSGIGQTAAMVVGSNTSAAYSENDLMRQRLAQNAGNGVDMQVTSMIVNEKLVVTVPAGTEMYMVFAKPATSSRTAAQNSK